jgi:hydrogenase nickel incorporation protein HypB
MIQVPVERKVLSENERVAAELRTALEVTGTLALNFIGSPGAGKTAFLERTLQLLPAGTRAAVLTGDIQTENDAIRLGRYGYPVRQITTAGACHLDARMVEKYMWEWRFEDFELLFIENVGNLVCPSSYDLGEAAKVVLLSVTEGDDKPLKYPSIFFKSDLFVLTKVDLLPYVPFSAETAEANARLVHPGIEIVRASATTDGGLDAWLAWLSRRMAQARQEAPTADIV